MLDCPIAATAPRIIDPIAKKTIINCHWLITFTKGTYINLIKTHNAAILGIKAKKLVTEVGEPSYTSGVHIWKGTAEILNAKPTKINTIPKVFEYFKVDIFSEIKLKFVDPEKPDTLTSMIDVIHACLYVYEQKGLAAVKDILQKTGRDAADSGFISVLRIIGSFVNLSPHKKLADEASVANNLLAALGHEPESVLKKGERLTDWQGSLKEGERLDDYW